MKRKTAFRLSNKAGVFQSICARFFDKGKFSFAVRVLVCGAGLVLGGATARGAIIVSDDFGRPDGTVLGSTSVGGLSWNEQETSASGLQISGGQVLAGSTTQGREYASVDLSGVAGYSPTLANNSGLITWTINMRTTRSDPSGLGPGSYGIALVLAASSSDITTANGYAVFLGGSGSPDDLRLVRFAGGLTQNGNTSLLTSGGGFGSDYLSIRVTYNPNGNQWSLYGVGGTSFVDPSTVNTQLGSTIVNSTYTGEALDFSGLLWNHGTSPDSAVFDNFSISAVPEPVNLALGIFSALCAAGFLAKKYLLKSRAA